MRRYFDNPKLNTPLSHPSDDVLRLLDSTKEKFIKIILENCPPNPKGKDFSVYTGQGGILYMFMYLYFSTKDERYLDQAELYTKSLQSIQSKRLKRNEGYVDRDLSFLEGMAGSLALIILYYHIKGNANTANELLKQLIGLSFLCDIEHIPNELLYGRSGYLYSCLFVNSFLKAVSNDFLLNISEKIYNEGKKYQQRKGKEPPLMWQWHEKEYLGAAHGVAGILYMILDLITKKEMMEDVIKTVDWAIHLQFSSGNFPSSVGNKSDRLVHWCHGAPGWVPLLLKMYKITKNEKYLNSAKKGGEAIWKYGLLKKGFGLCHGVAGNGFAFLYLYNGTKDKTYLYKAIEFAKFICDEKNEYLIDNPDRPFSLFEGIAGSVCFLQNLLDVIKNENEKIKFPAFDLI